MSEGDTSTEAKKTRVAILGGGIAGLTAAFELTQDETWKEKYEITIYQMGWRLGGKCATGRDPNTGRIEEHGIHAFSGMYYNALGLMWACYNAAPEALKTSGAMLGSFNEAFNPCNAVVLWERRMAQGVPRLVSWPVTVAANSMDPACWSEQSKNIEDIIDGAIRIGRRHYYRNVKRDLLRAPPDKDVFAWARRSVGEWADVFRFLGLLRETGVIGAAIGTGVKGITPPSWDGFLQVFHRAPVFTDFASVLWKGIFNKDYDLFADGFDAIDDRRFDFWLNKNGVTRNTAKSPIAFNAVDLSYNFPFGDNSIAPDMGAGTYLRWTLRTALNMKAFGWTFEAGTGETVIAPLYHVLKDRGVRFEFFHKVTALRLAEDGKGVKSVEVDIQATPNDKVKGYDPLTPVGKLLCWPNRPLFGQLEDGDSLEATYSALAKDRLDMESYWSPVEYRPDVLTRGRDFDTVVFALSIGAAPIVCRDLIDKNPDWKSMTESVTTCATQTMQIWLDEDSEALGSLKLMGRPKDDKSCVISGTYIDPFNGQADFSNLINYESWGHPRPKALWYFTGAMALDNYPAFTDSAFPKQQADRVKYGGIQFLQAAVDYLLPGSKKGTDWDPVGLSFERLATPPSIGALVAEPRDKGVKRFDFQFWKANIDPTERYVQAPTGSTDARLGAEESGFDNLVLAGDWIYNGLNIGSVEGAVMGGMLAARAVAKTVEPNRSWPNVIGYRPRVRPTAAKGPGA
jgi:uncharacterized protein with NAD-binding domain and iron-sulfur cluster